MDDDMDDERWAMIGGDASFSGHSQQRLCMMMLIQNMLQGHR
jgi:hypothetical protein